MPNEYQRALTDYQEEAHRSAQYPVLGYPIVYPTIGLTGEAGEVAEKVKKLCRDHNGVLNDERRTELCKELGDVLWYLAEIARQAGLTLGQVAQANIEKLADRMNRKKINGSGDNR